MSVIAPAFPAIAGDVIAPGDADYDVARRVWNGMIDCRPALIVRCAGVPDVAAALAHAQAHDLPLAVRGGGHNVAGTAVVEDGLVVDLSRMRGVRMDPSRRTVHVQGGATWADVDRVTAPLGLAAPGGVVSETGVAGLALSGGVSAQRRRDGMTIDNLVSADVVLADGRHVRASASEHADLFWALRGGGGNFGVVTSFELALHPLGPDVFKLHVAYPLADAAGVLAGWRDAVVGAPDQLSTEAFVWSLPVLPDLPEYLRGIPYVGVSGMWAGDPEAGEAATRALRELSTPLLDLCGTVPYLESQQALDPFFPAGLRYYWKAHYLETLSDEAIARTVRWSVEPPSPRTLVVFRHVGGAIARVPDDATPFAARDSEFMLSVDAIWDDPADDTANITWTRAFYDDVRACTEDGRPYFNFAGLLEDGDAGVRAAFGANHERLARIKAAYDPHNVFRRNPNIVPAR